MAKGDGITLEKLYLELGLDMSQLQADILAADRSVTENLGRLNRQQNTIKLRVEADVAGLDRVKDTAQILTIQEQGLNQQLSLSRDKLAILDAAYRQVASNQNSSAMAIQRAEQALQKQRIEVGRLESALRNLSAQKISLDTSLLQDNVAKLNAKIQNVRIKADIDTSRLKDAGSVFDAQKVHVTALTRELELQRQKLAQLQAQMYQSARATGSDSSATLNIKSNVLQQIQQINQLQTKLREVQATNINLQIRADSLKRVEADVQEKISLLNARIEHIRVKTDIDVSKIGNAASEFDKAKVHAQGLNRELDLQNKKLAEMRKALATSISANGLNNVKTINLQTEIQKQIQAIDQLKAKLNDLNKITPPKSNGLLSGYLNIKGDVAGKLNSLTASFNGITSASHSADGAINKTLEIIGAIPHPVGKAVAALVSIPLVIHGIENSLLDMAKAYIAAGDATYVMSRGMQLSVADMGKLSTIAKVTGIDINEVNSMLRRFSMQVTKADSNNLQMQTLKRYGAELYDDNGRLKNAVDLSRELGKALKAAEAEGNGAAFRDIVGGKFWSGNIVTYLEDFDDNEKLAAEIVKNKLANPTWAHQIQGEINALNAQAAQTGGAFSAALMPVTAEIVPHMRKQFAELANVIAANKDNVKFLGDAMALPVRILHEMTDGVISLSKAIDNAKDSGTTLGKVFDSYAKKRDDIAALMNVAPVTALTATFSPLPIDVFIAQYREEIERFKAERAKLEADAKAKDDERQTRIASTANLSALSEGERQKLQSTLESMDEERIKREEETADIIYKIHHGSYENKLRDLQRFKSEQLKIIEETEEELMKAGGSEDDASLDEEREALYKNIAAKQLQIEHEKEEKLAEIRQRIAAGDKTELENRMIAIEDEKVAWIDAGMEKAEAEKLAQKQLSDYLKSTQKELMTTITSLYQTELEKRLSQIEKERQAWIDKCDDEVQATKLAEQEKADAQRSAAMQVIKQQADAYKAYQEGGFKGLQAYQMAQLSKSGVDLSYLNMTPEQLMSFQKAQQVAEKSMLPNFMTDADKEMYRQQLAADQQRARVYDDQNYAIVNGVKVGMAEALGGKPINVTLADGSELKATADGRGSLTEVKTSNNGDETVTTERNFDLPQIFDDVPQSFLGISQATQGVVNAFGEIPTAVQGVSETLSGLDIPQMDEIANPLAGLDPEIQATVQQFSAMNTQVGDVVVKLSDLSAAIANLQLSEENSASNERTPVTVNVNVAINEAHAWDSEHIQELSEKVASELEPRIVGAIGGDDNSY